MSMHTAFTSFRKKTADKLFTALYRVFPVDADEITRLSGWMGFIAALLILIKADIAAAIVIVIMILTDGIDGTYARLQNKNSPQTDWGMDRFTEAILVGAVFMRAPESLFSLAFAGLFILNNFLPFRFFPVLPLRHLVAIYLIYPGITI